MLYCLFSMRMNDINRTEATTIPSLGSVVPDVGGVRQVLAMEDGKALIMDLGRTEVHHEPFWIIESTVASQQDNPGFEHEVANISMVSGYSVSKCLHYCNRRHFPDSSIDK